MSDKSEKNREKPEFEMWCPWCGKKLTIEAIHQSFKEIEIFIDNREGHKSFIYTHRVKHRGCPAFYPINEWYRQRGRIVYHSELK